MSKEQCLHRWLTVTICVWILQISTPEMRATLTNLKPSTLYTTKVSSLGQNGTSLPSPSLIFLTYAASGKTLYPISHSRCVSLHCFDLVCPLLVSLYLDPVNPTHSLHILVFIIFVFVEREQTDFILDYLYIIERMFFSFDLVI